MFRFLTFKNVAVNGSRRNAESGEVCRNEGTKPQRQQKNQKTKHNQRWDGMHEIAEAKKTKGPIVLDRNKIKGG